MTRISPRKARAAGSLGFFSNATSEVESAREAAQHLLARGARRVIVTLGEQGALACDQSAALHFPAFPVAVVDTTAAGDAFSGALAKFTPEVLAGLRDRGRVLKAGRAENSGRHGVVRLSDGSYQGAADSRREGVARMRPVRAAHARGGAN